MKHQEVPKKKKEQDESGISVQSASSNELGEDEQDKASPSDADTGSCAPADLTTGEAALLERPEVRELVALKLNECEDGDGDGVDDILVVKDAVMEDGLKKHHRHQS